MTRISDFFIPKNIIQVICEDLGINFIDIDIDFSANNDIWTYSDYKIIAPSENVANQYLSKTMYLLIKVYLENLPMINGGFLSDESMKEILSYAYHVIYDFNNISNLENNYDISNFSFISSLNVFPVSWIILKDILSPVYNINLKEIPIHCGNFYNKDVVSFFDSKQNSLCVNFSIKSKPIIEAYVLYFAIKTYLPDHDVSTVLKSIFLDNSLKKSILYFVESAMKNSEDLFVFFSTISLLSKTEEISIVANIYYSDNNIKTAQVGPAGNWWHRGLIEQMLAPVRGPDFSVTKSLKGQLEKLKERVKKERKLRGLVDLPMELLLRINSEDMIEDDKISLQKKLEEARVW